MRDYEIMTRWVRRIPNKRSKDCTFAGSGHIHSDDRAIYSYGSHFPMAYYLGEKIRSEPMGVERVVNIFLVNGDRYSRSTSRHQSTLLSVFNRSENCDTIIVSFNTLRRIGISPGNVKLSDIIDWQQSKTTQCWYYPALKRYFTGDGVENDGEQVDTKIGTFVPTGVVLAEGTPEERKQGYWHILGGALFKFTLSEFVDINGYKRHVSYQSYFLSAVDEGNYFISEIEYTYDVADAFQRLKPDAVLRAERAGLTIQRQGEFFFIDTGTTVDEYRISQVWSKKKMKETFSKKPLKSNGTNRHICHYAEIELFDKKVETFAYGTVKHVNSFNERSTGEHRPVELGETLWSVHRNTELRSWSAGGKVD